MARIGNFLFFYCIILPIAYIPIPIAYCISNGLALLLNKVVGYRKETILKNLRNSFPEKTNEEIKEIADKFYKHLADIFIEALLALRLSKKAVLQRYRFVNPELINNYFDAGKSVIIASAHYNNWEYMILSIALQLKFHGIGVGKQLSNREFGKILTKFRTRYGSEVIDSDNAREKFAAYEAEKKLSAYMMLADQSPNNSKKSYWTIFLNQPTGFIFGPEYFAKKYNYPVFFYTVNKVKRGYYEISFQPIDEEPAQSQHGSITEKYVHLLENLINQKPEYWLWSHKRWKHKPPNNQ